MILTEMEYNSSREELIMPEYGRNVQKLIQYAKTVENPEKRHQVVLQIIDLMFQMNPQSKNLEDYKEKLWKHLFRIADYDIEVTPPGGIKPTLEDHLKKPEPVSYPVLESKFRHYGHNIQVLIEKAIEMDHDSEKQAEAVNIIASYMKMAYKTWNREHYVSDDIVKNDLKAMTGGKLVVDDGVNLDKTLNSGANIPNYNNGNSGGYQRKRKRSGGYSNQGGKQKSRNKKRK
jgi:hypothetical protein